MGGLDLDWRIVAAGLARMEIEGKDPLEERLDEDDDLGRISSTSSFLEEHDLVRGDMEREDLE